MGMVLVILEKMHSASHTPEWYMSNSAKIMDHIHKGNPDFLGCQLTWEKPAKRWMSYTALQIMEESLTESRGTCGYFDKFSRRFQTSASSSVLRKTIQFSYLELRVLKKCRLQNSTSMRCSQRSWFLISRGLTIHAIRSVMWLSTYSGGLQNPRWSIRTVVVGNSLQSSSISSMCNIRPWKRRMLIKTLKCIIIKHTIHFKKSISTACRCITILWMQKHMPRVTG